MHSGVTLVWRKTVYHFNEGGKKKKEKRKENWSNWEERECCWSTKMIEHKFQIKYSCFSTNHYLAKYGSKLKQASFYSALNTLVIKKKNTFLSSQFKFSLKPQFK